MDGLRQKINRSTEQEMISHRQTGRQTVTRVHDTTRTGLFSDRALLSFLFHDRISDLISPLDHH